MNEKQSRLTLSRPSFSYSWMKPLHRRSPKEECNRIENSSFEWNRMESVAERRGNERRVESNCPIMPHNGQSGWQEWMRRSVLSKFGRQRLLPKCAAKFGEFRAFKRNKSESSYMTLTYRRSVQPLEAEIQTLNLPNCVKPCETLSPLMRPCGNLQVRFMLQCTV